MTSLTREQELKLVQLRAQHAQTVANAATRRARLLAQMEAEGRDDEIAESLLMQEARALGVPTNQIQAASGSQNWNTFKRKIGMTATVPKVESADNPELTVDSETSTVTIHRFDTDDKPTGKWAISAGLSGGDTLILLPEFDVKSADPIQKQVSEYILNGSPSIGWAIIQRWERMAQKVLEGQ